MTLTCPTPDCQGRMTVVRTWRRYPFNDSTREPYRQAVAYCPTPIGAVNHGPFLGDQPDDKTGWEGWRPYQTAPAKTDGVCLCGTDGRATCLGGIPA